MKRFLITILITASLAAIGYFGASSILHKDIKLPVIKENNKEVLISDKDIEKSIFKDNYKEAQKIVSKMTIEEKVGQLFLVQYNKNDVEYLSNFNVGGYLMFAKDFQNHTKESIKNEIDNNQSKNKYPLIIAVDEEGGFVTRVSRFTNFRNEKFLSPKNYYEQGGWELLEKTEKEKAELLKEIGVNLNLAPVADISTDENDFINNRAFGKGPKETSEFVRNMVKYANNNKINSCLKHFPGYGNNKDTHTGIAIDNRSYDSIKENDFLPFKAGIEEKVPCVLVSHNIITALDESHPASLSKEVISKLRNELGFTGIVMTDDLSMDAVGKYVENGEAATLAINSGNDMIITGNVVPMYKEVLKSIEDNKISEETINKAVLRIIAWKLNSSLFKGE